MIEALSGYAQLPNGLKALLLFPTGVVLGSFASALLHRLPRGEKFALARSKCPKCDHILSPMDLVPLLSFLLLRGRCRYCSYRLSWRYPLVELIGGLSGMASGAVGGWTAGALTLALFLLGVVVVAMWSRRQITQDEAGVTLVEVLIAVSLLVAIVIPMLDLGAVVRGLTPFQRQTAVSLAASKVEELFIASYQTLDWPSSGSDDKVVGQFRFHREWAVEPVAAYPDFSADVDQLRKVTVIVTCTNCTRETQAVRMVAIIEKL